MNIVAYAEQRANEKHIKAFWRKAHKVLEIETKHVTYQQKPWRSLMNFERRKFENQLFLLHAPEKVPLKFIYH